MLVAGLYLTPRNSRRVIQFNRTESADLGTDRIPSLNRLATTQREALWRAWFGLMKANQGQSHEAGEYRKQLCVTH